MTKLEEMAAMVKAATAEQMNEPPRQEGKQAHTSFSLGAL